MVLPVRSSVTGNSHNFRNTDSRRGASSGILEPIRVGVRLRRLPDGSGSAPGGGGGGLPAWRVDKTAGQQSVCLTTPHPGSTGDAATSGVGGVASNAPTVPTKLGLDRSRFSVDFAFDGNSSTREVFDAAAKDVVRTSFDGLNSTILAYGQTASGKTHSILGTLREPGVLPLAVQELFQAEGGLYARGLEARASYLEIFNERVHDLLASGNGGDRVSLPVKEDAVRGFYAQGLTEAPVRCARDVLRHVERGEDRRRYTQTRWNDYSSRSHVLFTLSIERLPQFQNQGGVANELSMQAVNQPIKLSIVDLAGCENHKFESSEDGRYINRSLFFLGEVITRLCASASGREGRSTSRRGGRAVSPETSWTSGASSPPPRRGRELDVSKPSRSPSRSRERGDFIPYRDSKLTRLLRSSLGGNAVTLLLCTIHPAGHFVEQSLTSLRFATKARCVQNCLGAATETDAPPGDQQRIVDEQRRIIEGLQNRLRTLELERQLPRVPALETAHTDGLMVEHLQGIRHELEAKERQLAARAHLLSERERQLQTCLRDQAVGDVSHMKLCDDADRGAGDNKASSNPSNYEIKDTEVLKGTKPGDVRLGTSSVATSQPSTKLLAWPDEGHTGSTNSARPLAQNQCGWPQPEDAWDHISNRRGAVDIDIPRKQTQSEQKPSWLHPQPLQPMASSGNDGSRSNIARGSNAAPPNKNGDSPGNAGSFNAFQQVHSRAEDIMCLRTSYVARQQTPIPPETPGQVHQGTPTSCNSQTELAERLLSLAVSQISTVKAVGERPPPDANVA